jgi:peroxiredoxin Q/BCP
VVIGISTDKLEDQQRFTDKENLNFPLFADADQKATKAFGVLMNGRPYAQRVTFIIDKNGIIRKIYEVKAIPKHPDEVLAYVKNNLAEKK